MMHNLVQNILVDLLEKERPKRIVRKEWEVANLTDWNKRWVIDVADITDPAHPVYYEIQQGQNPSFEEKEDAIAAGIGVDLHPIFIEDIERELGKNPRVLDLTKWLKERIV